MRPNFQRLQQQAESFIPFTRWIRTYSIKYLGYDSISGLTLAAYAIPVSMAYATLAGLPPQYGIYGYVLGGLFYTFSGTSRQLAIGPTSAISLIIGATLSSLADGSIQHWLNVASLTALVFAALSVVFYIFKLSSIIHFVSDTILLGFKAGAAIAIAMTQLPKLFGLPGGGESFYRRFILFIQQIPETNIYVFMFGVAAIGLIIGGERLFPHKPITIVVVIISIVIMSITPLASTGFKTVGNIPSGFPELHFPTFTLMDLQTAIPLALASFLLAFVESISAAQTLAHKNGYEVDARKEMLALGFANLGVSLGGGYPVSGGLSQSAVNDGAGAKTPMSLLFASFFISLCLLFLTGLLKNLPLVILAAIVLVAVKGLVDFKEFKRLYKINRFDLFVASTALVSVVIFGILQGVIIAAVASLILMIKAVSNPHVAFLGKIPDTTRYSDFKRHHKNEEIPGVLIFRVESSLWYFNVSNVYTTIWTKILASDASLEFVIFDLSTSASIDSSGAQFIKKLYLNLKEINIQLKIVEAHSEVRDILRLEGIEHLLGHVSRRESVHDIVTSFLEEHQAVKKEILL
jgi:high affinity sulfate transporter 1